jgi:hypothetical protein
VLFVGGGVKRRPGRIIQLYIGLERNSGERGEVNSTEVYITNDELCHCNPNVSHITKLNK